MAYSSTSEGLFRGSPTHLRQKNAKDRQSGALSHQAREKPKSRTRPPPGRPKKSAGDARQLPDNLGGIFEAR